MPPDQNNLPVSPPTIPVSPAPSSSSPISSAPSAAPSSSPTVEAILTQAGFPPPETTAAPSTPQPVLPDPTPAIAPAVDRVVQQALTQDSATYNSQAFLQISREEHQAVLTKMSEMLIKLPVGHAPKEEELYLEQQLTDMFGFEVVSQLEDHRLDHTLGVMAALPHLKRFPQDTLADHQQYPEAGLGQTRGGFGWFTIGGELTPLAIAREKYTFSVQVDLLSSRKSDYHSQMNWFGWKKMIMINPAEQRAVVGCVGDIGPRSWLQHQFGATPEVIRQGKVWSPRTNGKVFLFFLNDLDDQIPYGVIDLRYPEKGLGDSS